MGRLKEIAIVAMGPTWYQAPRDGINGGEVWGINTIYKSNIFLDKLFIMHDPRKDMFLFDKDFLLNMEQIAIPVYASRVYSEIPTSVAYPIYDIMKEFKVGFFINVMAYAIAYAVSLNPEKISMYGTDMRPDSGVEHHREEKGCVEFWLGVATGRGIDIYTPPQSFLLKRTMVGNFYGFEPRATADGMIKYIPENMEKIYKDYKLIPIDKDGNDVVADQTILSLTMGDKQLHDVQTQDGSVPLESIKLNNPKIRRVNEISHLDFNKQ